MLRIYIGFQATKFYCFPPPKPPLPPPPHFYCFLSSSSSSSSFLLFFLLLLLLLLILLFFLHHHHHRHHISIVFPPPDSIKDYQLPFLVHFVAMSRVVNNNRGFLQLLAACPAPVSFKDSYTTATSCTSPSLIQFTHGTHSYLRRK